VLFENDFCKATIEQVAESFRVGGMLNTAVAAVGIFLLHSKYKNSPKMVAPFHISVRSCIHYSSFHIFFLLFFTSFIVNRAASSFYSNLSGGGPLIIGTWSDFFLPMPMSHWIRKTLYSLVSLTLQLPGKVRGTIVLLR
jgi:hypothetical protein